MKFYNRNMEIWRKVTEQHHSVEMTIQQMEYLSALTNMQIFEDMQDLLEMIENKKGFLDKMQIPIEDEIFEEYLKLYSFPGKLKKELERKLAQLSKEHSEIMVKINQEVARTKNTISSAFQKFEKFHHIGLQTIEEVEASITAATKNQLKTLIQTAKDEGQKYVWNNFYINQVAEEMIIMMDDIKEAEKSVKNIIKQQQILHVEQAQFPDLHKLKQTIKPVLQLWEAVIKFNQSFDHWWNRPFASLELNVVE